MDSDERDAFDKLISGSASAGPKNPKGSSRQKFNRRKVWLAHALYQMEIAISDLLSQGGTVYKRQEIDLLKEAIDEFRDKTGLKSPELAPPTQEELDGFIDMLSNLKPWEPPSKEELAELYAALGQVPDMDERAEEGGDTGC